MGKAVPSAERLEERFIADRGRVKRVTVAVDEGPLSWLASRGMISKRQFEAGDMLRTDYERAAIGPQVTMNWSVQTYSKVARSAPAAHHATEMQVSAKDRFDGACKAAGRGLVDVLWRCVCNSEKLPDVERTMGWPVRSGKVVLCLALDRLADFYGLPED